MPSACMEYRPRPYAKEKAINQPEPACSIRIWIDAARRNTRLPHVWPELSIRICFLLLIHEYAIECEITIIGIFGNWGGLHFLPVDE